LTRAGGVAVPVAGHDDPVGIVRSGGRHAGPPIRSSSPVASSDFLIRATPGCPGSASNARSCAIIDATLLGPPAASLSTSAGRDVAVSNPATPLAKPPVASRAGQAPSSGNRPTTPCLVALGWLPNPQYPPGWLTNVRSNCRCLSRNSSPW